ncbi:putative Tigger transposable element-derived protein 1-like 234, partial [Homarus americanus]
MPVQGVDLILENDVAGPLVKPQPKIVKEHKVNFNIVNEKPLSSSTCVATGYQTTELNSPDLDLISADPEVLTQASRGLPVPDLISVQYRYGSVISVTGDGHDSFTRSSSGMDSVSTLVSSDTPVSFDELESEDIEDVLAFHTEELTNKDLLQLTEHSPVEEDDEEEPQRMLTSKRLAELLNMFQQALQMLRDDDPNRENRSKQQLAQKTKR